MITTDFGSYASYADDVSPEATVFELIGAGDPVWGERVYATGAYDRMVEAYRKAIADVLEPAGVWLVECDLIGPYQPGVISDEVLDIRGLIASVDLNAILERFDPDGADPAE